MAILLAAAFAASAACIGPLWSRAAEESVVRARLKSELVSAAGFTATRVANSGIASLPRPPVRVVAEIRDAAVLPPEIDGYFDEARITMALPQLAITHQEVRAFGQLLWREGQCAHLTVVGRCPQAVDEVMLTRRSAGALGVELGEIVKVDTFAAVEPPQPGSGDPFVNELMVSGIYEPPDTTERYWFDRAFFDFKPAEERIRDPMEARLDAVLATPELLHAFNRLSVEVTAERALRANVVGVDEVDRIEAPIADLAAGRSNPEHIVGYDAPLLSFLEALDEERTVVRAATLLGSAQLLILAWYALGLVVTGTSDARSGEVALAKLRGLPVRMTVWHGVAEPLLLLIFALPLGVLLSYGMTRVLTGLLLTPGTPVRFGWPVAAAVGLASGGAVLTIVLVSRRGLQQPVADQLRRIVPAPQRGRVVAVEAVVLTLAIFGAWQLLALGPAAAESGLGLLAPALIAVAVAVMTGRVVILSARVWARRTRLRPRVPAFLASRQIARRQGLARIAVLVTTATALSAFAAQAWSIAGGYRENRAAMELGAATVLEVDTPSPLGLAAATVRADPDGRDAMAVAVVDDPQLPADRRLIAVDSRRLAAVSAWRQEWSHAALSELTARLRPRGVPRLDVAGTRWRVDVDVRLRSQTDPPLLLAHVRRPDGTAAILNLGLLRHQQAILDAAVDPFCADGCRLVELSIARAPGTLRPFGGTVLLRRLTVDGRPIQAAFSHAEHWRPTVIEEQRDSAQIRAIRGGLELTFQSMVSEAPTIVRADVPLEVAAVVSSNADPIQGGSERRWLATGLDGANLVVTEAGSAEVIPVLGRDGVLVDIESAGLIASHIDAEVRYQVWLRHGASSSVIFDLQNEGVVVRGMTTIAGRTAEFAAEGPGLALLLMLFTSMIALVIAAAAAVASAFAESRRRAYELAALRTVGLRTTDLRRAAALEHAVLLLAGMVLGLATGVLIAWLASEAIPVATDLGSGPPLIYAPSWRAVIGVAVLAASLLGVAGLLGVRQVLAMSKPALLREAQV